MNNGLEQSEIRKLLAESDQKESREAQNNLLGLFEVLIGIDERLKAEVLVKSKNLVNNELKETN